MIVLNGEPRERDGATIVELLSDLGVEQRARGVAVAVNGEIVPRAQWPSHHVDTGDRVEAVSAMQGG
jgi:sulfur carrier protein